MTHYTLLNREPGLLPFNSTHHRYYRADSQVLSFFFLYNSSCFFSTLCSPDPNPPLPPSREKHYRCTILFGVKTGPSNHSALISLTLRFCFVFFCITIGFGTFFFLNRAANRIYIHHHSLQVPDFFSFPDDRRDLTFRQGGNYDCLLYKNVQWLY